jgi:hypothetical protein
MPALASACVTRPVSAGLRPVSTVVYDGREAY